MSVELRARQAATAMHDAFADVRVPQPPSRGRVVRRRLAVAVVALGLLLTVQPVRELAQTAGRTILRRLGLDDAETAGRIQDVDRDTGERSRPREAPDRRPEGGRGPQPRTRIAPNGSSPSERRTRGAPAVSPTADRIAFVAGQSAQIYVMDADGSNKTFLGPGAEPSWSPDGKRLTYTRSREQGSCASGPPGVENPMPCTVWIMNADGSNQHFVAEGASPDWSPDGRRIAYAAQDDDAEIHVMNTDGSESVRVTDSYRALTPDWSPDGERIAYAHLRPEGPSGWTSQVYVVDADGANAQEVSAGPGDLEPAWSGDGTRIAFMSDARSPGNNYEIYTVAPDGRSDTQRLTTDAPTGSTMDNFDGSPTWTPDGRILFTRDADGPAGTTGYCYLRGGKPYCGTGGPAPPWIVVMNADGSHAIRLGEGRQGVFAPRTAD